MHHEGCPTRGTGRGAARANWLITLGWDSMPNIAPKLGGPAINPSFECVPSTNELH